MRPRALPLLATLAASPLAAQAPGMPARFDPGALPGVTASVDLAPGTGTDGRLSLSLAYATLTGTFGHRHGGANGRSAMLTLHLVRDYVRPFSLSFDAAWGKAGIRSDGETLDGTEVLVGAAAGLNCEGVCAIQVPWVAARVVWRDAAPAGGTGDRPVARGYGLSAGTSLRFSALLPQLGRLGGPSLHVTGDVLSMPRFPGTGRVTEWRLSFGIAYTFAFKGFPERGLIPAPGQMVR